jgi:HEAT repeat protein
MQFLEYGYVPGVSAWADLKAAEAPSLKDFPKQLLKALENPGSKDYETALAFVLNYAALARTCASSLGQSELEPATRRSFAPYTRPMEAALIKGLDARPARLRHQAALALLVFRPDHARANALLAEALGAKGKGARQQTCEKIGWLCLAHRDAVDALARALRDKEPDVRRAAANALAQLGQRASAAVPALIAFLESGDAARGTVETPLAMRLPQTANLALLALGNIGPAARPAVPVILRRFPTSDKQTQREMLLCLAGIGPAAREGAATLAKAMRSGQPEFRMTAACALLCVAPEDRAAAALLNDALKGKEKEARGQALRACVEVGPTSTALVAALRALLEDEDEYTRIGASEALGRIGPGAAAAVPALEKLLTRADDHMRHTFLSHSAAAHTLSGMGKEGAAALIRATAPESGGRTYAIHALGSLGREASPAAVACLIRILSSKAEEGDARFHAAIALGQIGERARSARRALEAIAPQEEEMGLALAWALMEIPR